MDTQILKARSIELAERAYRQESRLSDSAGETRLNAAGNILIQVEDTSRFYNAQTVLESANAWTEEQRALAHEINVADQTIRNIEPVANEATYSVLDNWAQKYLLSTTAETIKTGQNILAALNVIRGDSPNTDKKDTLNYLITMLEAILSHIHVDDDTDEEQGIVIKLRGMRDSLLSERELLYDEAELITKSKTSNEQINNIELARETLRELYTHIKPITQDTIDGWSSN